MRTTILVGYAKTDASGNPSGPARVISGPPADESERREQAATFDAAKRLHVFPKGVRYIAFCVVEDADVAAFISPAVAEQIQGREQIRLTALEVHAKKAQEREKAAEAFKLATKAVSTAAVKLNETDKALQAAKNNLLECEATFKQTKADSAKAAIEEAKAQVDAAAAAVEDAKKNLESAKKDKADLTNPKPD